MAKAWIGNFKGPPGKDGGQGPEGPQGPQGVQGPKGDTGDPNAGTAPNLLCNWYFADPINQRGVSGTISKDGYFIDRWKTNAGEYHGKLTLSELGLTMDQSNTTPYNIGVFQFLEFAPQEELDYTISVLASNNEFVTATAKFKKGQRVQFQKDDVAFQFVWVDGPVVLFANTDKGQKTFVAVKLELGDHQTLAHQENGVWVLNEIPDPALELARCQRYYKRLSGQGSYISHSGNLIVARAMGRDTAQLWIPTPTPMRATPVVRLRCTLDFGEFDTILDVTASSVIVGQNAVTCHVTGGEFDFDGVNTHYLHYADLCERGDYIELDAEL